MGSLAKVAVKPDEIPLPYIFKEAASFSRMYVHVLDSLTLSFTEKKHT